MDLQAKKPYNPPNTSNPKPYRNQGGGGQPACRQGGSGGAGPGAHQAEVPKNTNRENSGTGQLAFQQQGRPVLICQYCRNPGHTKSTCPKLAAQERRAQTNCVQRDTVISQPSLPAWLIDSGSTDHISPSSDNMINYVKFDVPQRLIVANGKSEEIIGEGSMQVFLESGSSLFLHNVKHVPSSKKYLLSVGKA
eukprot:jgi/Botrbrau1/128/Bobra.0022s0114.1